jgi:hypothetical protein
MQENAILEDDDARVDESLIPDLREYQRQITAVTEEARELIAGLSEAQFNWRPTPAHWSIAECLDHLTVTNRELLEGMKAAVSAARTRGLTSQGPFRYGMIGNMIIRSMEPPVKLKFKAPGIFKPRPEQTLKEVARDFFAMQDEVQRLILEANGINLKRVKIPSPVTRLFKLSLGQMFGLIATHDRRHLWQARQVKTDPAFPVAAAAL